MFNDYRELIQFTPARAKKKFSCVEDVTQADCRKLWEQKIDGERFLLHTDRPVADKFLHGLTSRRISEVTGRFVEKTDRVPHLTNAQGYPAGCLIDNEIAASGDMMLRELPGKFWDKLVEPTHPHMIWLKKKFGGAIPVYPHVSQTTSIMGSLGPEAVRKQNERGIVWAYAFDIMQFSNRSVLNQTQVARRRLLASILEKLNPEVGHVLMPQWQRLTVEEIVEFFYLLTDPFEAADGMGGEGLIGKEPDDTYNAAKAWWKLKRDYPVDVVFTGGYKLGEHGKTGQMLGKISSLEIGVYHNGVLQSVGWISAIMDGHHNLIDPSQMDEVHTGKVTECRHNGTQKDPESPLGISLRHPRFRRRREDKNPIDCTFAALMAETGKSRD